MSFGPADLARLDALLSQASAVVAMQEIHGGNTSPNVIGLRHDVDHTLAHAVKMARWEADRGYRSTYFILHHAPYWRPEDPGFMFLLEELVILGHEVGLHTNSLAEALRQGRDPHEILGEALEPLRRRGFPMRGVVAHGDHLCGPVGFVNDEVFEECARPGQGAPDRELHWNGRTVTLAPVPLGQFGFTYEAYRLPKTDYLSDSGGQWSQPPANCHPGKGGGQLHMLVHWDWWRRAL